MACCPHPACILLNVLLVDLEELRVAGKFLLTLLRDDEVSRIDFDVLQTSDLLDERVEALPVVLESIRETHLADRFLLLHCERTSKQRDVICVFLVQQVGTHEVVYSNMSLQLIYTLTAAAAVSIRVHLVTPRRRSDVLSTVSEIIALRILLKGRSDHLSIGGGWENVCPYYIASCSGRWDLCPSMMACRRVSSVGRSIYRRQASGRTGGTATLFNFHA